MRRGYEKFLKGNSSGLLSAKKNPWGGIVWVGGGGGGGGGGIADSRVFSREEEARWIADVIGVFSPWLGRLNLKNDVKTPESH